MVSRVLAPHTARKITEIVDPTLQRPNGASEAEQRASQHDGVGNLYVRRSRVSCPGGASRTMPPTSLAAILQCSKPRSRRAPARRSSKYRALRNGDRGAVDPGESCATPNRFARVDEARDDVVELFVALHQAHVLGRRERGDRTGWHDRRDMLASRRAQHRVAVPAND